MPGEMLGFPRLYPTPPASHIDAMALWKIARMGHPVLRARAAEIDDPKAPWVRQLVEDRIETMEDAAGTGIAAPQLHVPYRVVAFHGHGERLTDLPAVSERDRLIAAILPDIAFDGWSRHA